MNFRNIIILMLLTLIGLIAFQWYWIENAISVKKEQFDRDVNDALQATVKQIEKQEVMFLANQQMKVQEQKRLLAITQHQNQRKRLRKPTVQERNATTMPLSETLVNAEPQERENTRIIRLPQGIGNQGFTIAPSDIFLAEPSFEIPARQMSLIREMLEEQNLAWDELNQPTRSLLMRQRSVEDLIQAINHQVVQLSRSKRNRQTNNMELKVDNENGVLTYNYYYESNLPTDSLNLIVRKTNKVDRPIEMPRKRQEQNIQTSYERTKNKAELVRNVFSDVIQGSRDIYERLDRQTLDTLLKKELHSRGITIPYQYGVKNGSNMIFSSFAVNYSPELLKKSHKMLLFPNDLQPQSHFLYVYFPNTQDFILRNMWTQAEATKTSTPVKSNRL